MIFHITTRARWLEAEQVGLYRADSLTTEDFIHASTEDQVARVANGLFRGQNSLVVLHIDPQLLGVTVKLEGPEGSSELFPHIYGPVQARAVTRVSALDPGPDGDFSFILA